ncbi:salivary mucin, putative, partial [Ixodes scapularis]
CFDTFFTCIVSVAIVLVNCQIYPDVIAHWNRTGPIIIKHGCPTTARTEEAAFLFPRPLTFKNGMPFVLLSFRAYVSLVQYGPEKRPGSCFYGNCYLITDTITEATPPDITQRTQVENGTTPTPPVENDIGSTPPMRNGTSPTE